MIVDAGGGTIDLSAYCMTLSSPAFEEIAPAECEPSRPLFHRKFVEITRYRSITGICFCQQTC